MSQLLLRLFLPLSLFFSINTYADEVRTLDWLDLIPVSEKQDYARQMISAAKPAVDHNSSGGAQQSMLGMPRQDLDGKHVKIPGFVIPLEGDDQYVTEFLLVPFMGACIHVPPPPPNQVVYVKFKEGIAIEKLWEVVVVEGIMHVQTTTVDLAQSGYLLEGIDSQPYEREY